MMKFAPLAESFFAPSASIVARRLLGHWLLRVTEAGICGGRIVETEAYLEGDPAAHGFIGETPRNRVMFGPPGRAYVYFIYGNHYCVNAVCRGVGRAEAVLIRAVEAEIGLDILRLNRAGRGDVDLTNGPGKLCEAMMIDRTMDGANLCDASSLLWLATDPEVGRFRKSRGPVQVATRVGLSKAADWPMRFYLEDSPYVSKRGQGTGPKREPGPA